MTRRSPALTFPWRSDIGAWRRADIGLDFNSTCLIPHHILLQVHSASPAYSLFSSLLSVAMSHHQLDDLLESLYDHSSICQHAWLVRPHPPYNPLWLARFQQDLLHLGQAAFDIYNRDPTSDFLAPPFTLSWVAEHNRTWSCPNDFDIEHLDPALAPEVVGCWIRMESYQLPARRGWWENPQSAFKKCSSPRTLLTSRPLVSGPSTSTSSSTLPSSSNPNPSSVPKPAPHSQPIASSQAPEDEPQADHVDELEQDNTLPSPPPVAPSKKKLKSKTGEVAPPAADKKPRTRAASVATKSEPPKTKSDRAKMSEKPAATPRKDKGKARLQSEEPEAASEESEESEESGSSGSEDTDTLPPFRFKNENVKVVPW